MVVFSVYLMIPVNAPHENGGLLDLFNGGLHTVCLSYESTCCMGEVSAHSCQAVLNHLN